MLADFTKIGTADLALDRSSTERYDQGNMGARELKLDAGQFALISKAIADPKRFEMLQRIAASKEVPTCSCVRAWLGLAPATISHHLRELESAGLVSVERNGKFAHISLRRDVLDAYVNRLSSL
jgi:ArsR family transcriptional regulator